jgi:hypothetical protein
MGQELHFRGRDRIGVVVIAPHLLCSDPPNEVYGVISEGGNLVECFSDLVQGVNSILFRENQKDLDQFL